MFDLNRWLALVRGGLLDADATWQSYHSENRSWQETAVGLTVPTIIIAMVLAGLLSILFSGFYSFPHYGGFGFWLLNLIYMLVGFALAVVVFTYLAGIFKGNANFNRGVAALSLAGIPTYTGIVLGTLPKIGWLISLALSVLGLVYLYRLIPLYLEVPDEKRVVHFIASLVVTVILGMLLGYAFFGVGATRGDLSGPYGSSERGPRDAGFAGDVARQSELYDAAMADRFEPPDDARLTENQVEEYLRVMTSARKIQEEHAKKLDDMGEKMKGKDEASLSDISKLYAGMSSVMAANNAPMDVVKSSGGNWAEHVWVEEQLRLAKYQPDLNEAVRENAELLRKYKEQLSSLETF